MIIVSQNKEMVFNFDNIEYLQIVGNDIICSISGDIRRLATYETKERAQEVCDYIIDRLGIANYFARLPEV